MVGPERERGRCRGHRIRAFIGAANVSDGGLVQATPDSVTAVQPKPGSVQRVVASAGIWWALVDPSTSASGVSLVRGAGSRGGAPTPVPGADDSSPIAADGSGSWVLTPHPLVHVAVQP